MFSLLALAAMVLPLAFAATPALAGPPTSEVTVEDHVTSDGPGDLCGFEITYTDNGTFKVTTFYDRAGNPVKEILSNRGPFTETASANGKTLKTNYPTVFITSLPSGAYVQLGLRAAFHAPGTGVVLLDAGSIVFSPSGDVVFEAGQHQILDGDVDAFCAYFA
jgi:hypothetical protein